MKLRVRPSRLRGAIAVPGSKSHTIRGIAAALMAGGESRLCSPLSSADTESALAAARALGAMVERDGADWRIRGTGGALKRPPGTLDLGNSGTGLRILTGLATSAGFPVSFDGDASLRTRLMAQLLDALAGWGAQVESSGGFCPLTVTGPLRGGHTRCDGTTSQFLTSLLFAAPYAAEPCSIELDFLNEAPYIEITLAWLERLGIVCEASADRLHYRIPAPQRMRAFEVVIPADFSTACFPLVAGALFGDGVAIRNLDFSDPQGDKAVFGLVESMGATLTRGEELLVEPGTGLRGGNFDLNRVPDALPIMAVAGAYARGETRLLNVPQARVKETDRIQCMTSELRKFGAEVEELPDGMILRGGGGLRGAEVESHEDHRLAMALAIAALGAQGESVINHIEAAVVTYPDFVADFTRLGADFKLEP